MASSAERQRAFKARMNEQGFEQVTVWVRSSQAASVRLVAKQLAENPDLEFGPLRDAVSGQLVRRAI